MKKALLLLWISFIALMLALFFTPHFLIGSLYADKMMHIFTLCVFMLGPVFYFRKWRSIFYVALLVLVIAAIAELAQGFVPGRTTEILDFAANAIGILCGLFIGYLLRSGYEAQLNPNIRSSMTSS